MFGAVRHLERDQLGAALDDRTNVYRLGSTALLLLGENALPEALRAVALKATSPVPEERYAYVADFTAAWRAAILS